MKFDEKIPCSSSIPSASASPTSAAGSIRSGGFFDYDAKVERLEEVNRELENPDIWNDSERAQALGRERSLLDKTVTGIRELSEGLVGAGELLDLVELEDDQETANAITEDVERYARGVDALEFQRMFSGKMDSHSAFVDIQAGAGGTEAQDWAQMLVRMYTRWAERRGFEIEVLDVSEGEEAGIKGAVLEIRGQYAYGFLRPETGVHRLVRISPFDANARRHTSFASVFVYPVVNEEINIEIREEDLRIDVYRASGAGGQHVNKTSSAVRITHIPTNTVVASQQERSQFKNKSTAMKMLKNKLYQAEIERREAHKAELDATKSDVSFGSQIRSYVFQPYTMVNDHRTELKIPDVQKVMDGGIDPFIEAYLKLGGGSKTAAA